MPGERVPLDRRAAILRLYRDTEWTVEEIAAEHETTPRTVWRIAAQAGARRKGSVITSEQRIAVLTLLEAGGLSDSRIATRVGVCQQTVSRIHRRLRSAPSGGR